MRAIKAAPATVTLIVLNTIVFAINYFSIGTFQGPRWTLGMLEAGALFNPYTLDGEWYRIFSHMFMHGGIIHLIVNMYGLYSLGTDLEPYVGTKKFIVVYLVSGIGAAITTLSISILTIGVGASGAIFGMYGFAIVTNITRSRENNISLTPLFINFAIFLGINLLIAKAVHADNAAHAGGLITGLIIGLFSFITRTNYSKIRLEFILLPLFILIFFLIPRYQVQYFNFYQRLFDVEEQLNEQSHEKHTDEEFLKIYQKGYVRWDSTLQLLDSISYFPKSLQQDTARVRAYIQLAKKEYEFRIIMLEKESFIYLDSIEYVHEQMQALPRPEHVPYFRMPKEASSQEEDQQRPEPIKVLYDSNWIEIPDPPAMYYRIGTKDSLGNWHGKVTDYFANDDVQMRGEYKNGKRNGVFIYYADHRTYLSAGRYRDNLSFGKWEYYHDNGKLESEVYYRNRYFLKNLWDSTGIQLVKDGNGVETRSYANGVIALSGEYIDGYKEGYWYGRYENGKMYFEENFFNGRLVNGRSFNAQGDIYYYDESSFYPLPEGGPLNLKKYLTNETAKITSQEGVVRLSFRVTATGRITDMLIEKSASDELNTKAKEILLQGPRWLPGKKHGLEPVDSYSFVEMTFQKIP